MIAQHPRVEALATRSPRRLNRRVRALVVLVEATAAGLTAGLAISGRLGVIVVVATALLAAAALLLPSRIRRAAPARADDSARHLGDALRVVGVESRSSGEVGVISDRQGYAAGLELELDKGIAVGLATLCDVAASDPSRPSSLQIRLTCYAPPTSRGPHTAVNATYLRLHVVLRLEPVWAGEVVVGHGGGASGSRSALIAAVDRLAARLRRAGVGNHILDAAALGELLAEDTDPDRPRRQLALDPSSQADFERVIVAVRAAGAERGVVSLVTDLVSGGVWHTRGAIMLTDRNPRVLDDARARLLTDAAISIAVQDAVAASVLPLGGGPGDLTAVLTLGRL